MGEFIVAPWTDTSMMLRPVVFGRRPFNGAVIAQRAALLAPTPDEAEALRRAMVLASIDQVRVNAAAAAVSYLQDSRGDVLEGQAIPGPEGGGFWSDVAPAEAI